ncbi:hypothetical protein F4820DRAFT_438157 [Hypoxylon rubiginosum]|uniref:Uncharacterized protein n=1 Tax=Hypoxylon rubiginosum TaxID=110542 RepID=A0ACB9YM15_9PEZI|nr:hypothetical protein F4820DRAFT_438157 [Hypoxylon rubiginosum]
MKLSSASLSVILAASLASVQGYGIVSVSKFSAGATPHSSIGYIELSWSRGQNETRCSARPGTYQSFPSVGKTSCSAPSTAFSLTKRDDGGADLSLFSGNAQAIHTITKDEIVWANQQSPTGTVQVYSGPQNFTAELV